jgi:hypothetical protein
MATRPLHSLEVHSLLAPAAECGGARDDTRLLGVAIQEIFLDWTRSHVRQLAGGQPPEGLGPPPVEMPPVETPPVEIPTVETPALSAAA